VQPRNPNCPISAMIDLSKVSFLCKNMISFRIFIVMIFCEILWLSQILFDLLAVTTLGRSLSLQKAFAVSDISLSSSERFWESNNGSAQSNWLRGFFTSLKNLFKIRVLWNILYIWILYFIERNAILYNIVNQN
jgi:hypothetical protein